jgi:hypothetical protein
MTPTLQWFLPETKARRSGTIDNVVSVMPPSRFPGLLLSAVAGVRLPLSIVSRERGCGAATVNAAESPVAISIRPVGPGDATNCGNAFDGEPRCQEKPK